MLSTCDAYGCQNHLVKFFFCLFLFFERWLRPVKLTILGRCLALSIVYGIYADSYLGLDAYIFDTQI